MHKIPQWQETLVGEKTFICKNQTETITIKFNTEGQVNAESM